MKSLSFFSALALCVAASLQAQAPVVTTVLSNGTTDSRYDMVILGDGYTASQQALFNQHVNTFLTGLFQKPPYSIFAAYYNVHTVFRASQQSGADRPDENPPVFVNTAYEATYNYGGTDRCLYIQNTSLALADAALAPANEGRVLVMVNDTRYGGCASTFAVSYTGSSMVEVQSHELGHSLGALADEYDYPYGTYGGGEPSQVNISANSAGQKWSIWWGTDGVSAFQGAGYYQFGLYRPRNNCLMRALGQPLCRVCQENITRITNSVADVITSPTPSTTSVQVARPSLQQFSFSHFVPAGNGPVIEWLLDGAVQPGAATTTFTLDSNAVALGSHTLVARITDHSDRVRSDPAQVMVEEHTWQVSVFDPTLAQLRVSAMFGSSVWVTPGDAVTITPTITNDGPGASGPFEVEFFLGNLSWMPQDTLLGKISVGNLAAGQTVSPVLPLRLPYSMLNQLYLVRAYVDRADVVTESNENDNQRTVAVFGQTGPCVTGLEFQDALTTPFAAELSLAAGGTLHPTVVARCANPTTTLYLIAWGGSGTQPGLPLGPGVTLPINPDGFTQLGLDGLNGPVFGGFLGLLDATGIGRATFTLPPSTALVAGTTHFAPLLLGSATLFQESGNAIELQLGQ
ncbi:MAG: M64 family metallopeptidase [Planctomycetota bacterium]